MIFLTTGGFKVEHLKLINILKDLSKDTSKVYANDKDHPIDAETNQRLKEYQMNPLELMKLKKAQKTEKGKAKKVGERSSSSGLKRGSGRR